MKRNILFQALLLIAVLVFVVGAIPTGAVVVPNVQSSTDTGLGAAEYRVGQMAKAATNVGKEAYSAISEAFQGAFDMFDDGYDPISHVVNENGYYSQTYSNNAGKKASIYVDKDNKAYSVGWPIYDSWDSVGGIEKTGYPIADAYAVGDEYYQNFSNGYVRYSEGAPLSFFPLKRVTEQGVEIPYENKDTTSLERRIDLEDNKRSVDSNDNKIKNQDNSINQNNSGTGADASGRAGSLDSSAGTDPLMAILGLVILAAVVILLVSLSVASAENKD